ncbi:Biofilm growth-associated repressor [Methylophilaceae bacterium]|nr:Biofilm growth-associated repressor [Methylophilaceae bacterium]
MNIPVETMDFNAMRDSAGKASALLKALSNPDRLMLLCQLTKGEHCVGDLEQRLGLQQPSLSQQLTVLRQERLVNTRREGKQIFYSIASREAMAVMQLLYAMYCKPCHEEGKHD